jgi:hypothetical protein
MVERAGSRITGAVVVGKRAVRLLAGLLWVLVLAACGGGGGGGGFAAQDAKPGGLWQGTVRVAGEADQDIFGLVSETKQFHFFQADGVQYFGTLSTSGTRVTASFTGVPPAGTSFADGSVQGTGALTGTVQERSSITFTAAFTTANNTTTNASVTLTYDPSYDADSALATVAGNYATVVPGSSETLNIAADGVLFLQDPDTLCVGNGTVTLIDAAYDLYNVELTFASCVAPADVLNGLHLTGLLTIDSTTVPNRVLLAMHGVAGGIPLALLAVYQRT